MPMRREATNYLFCIVITDLYRDHNGRLLWSPLLYSLCFRSLSDDAILAFWMGSRLGQGEAFTLLANLPVF